MRRVDHQRQCHDAGGVGDRHLRQQLHHGRAAEAERVDDRQDESRRRRGHQHRVQRAHSRCRTARPVRRRGRRRSLPTADRAQHPRDRFPCAAQDPAPAHGRPATNITSAKPMSAMKTNVGSSESSHPMPVLPRAMPASSSPRTTGMFQPGAQGQQRTDQSGRCDDRQRPEAHAASSRPAPTECGPRRRLCRWISPPRSPSSRRTTRTVLGTRRRDGRPQLSPVNSGLVDGMICISSRAPLAKVRNIRRDPQVSVLIFNEEFFGSWVQSRRPGRDRRSARGFGAAGDRLPGDQRRASGSGRLSSGDDS